MLIEDYKKIYIRALQLESMARGLEDNNHDTPFLADQLILDELTSSVHRIRKYKGTVISASRANSQTCPTSDQIAEARQLSGWLFSYIL